MVEAILTFFTSEQKAQSIVADPMIELIFMVLFIIFFATIFVHFSLYLKLRRIRNYISETNSLEIAPVNTFQGEFEYKNKEESVKVETFVQKKFSSWRFFNIPVVSLIKMIQMTVSIFILVGVLGTFIGLAMSLGSITTTGDQLVENVAQVLAGIDVAFYTSIAGMGLSLLMTIVTRVANSEYLLTDIMLKTESYLEENEQDAMARLIHVSETINSSINELRETNQESLQSIVQSFHGFQEYTVGLQQSAKDLAAFNEGLSENLKDFTVLIHSVKEVTDGFDKGVTKLNKNFDQLFSYFYKMDQRNERMTSAFTETYKKIDELSTSQIESMNQFHESVVDLKDYFSVITTKQELIHHAFERMIGQSDQLARMMKENNQQFERILGSDVSSKLTGINQYLGEMKNDFHKLGHAIGRLPDELETINRAQGDYKQLLTNRFDELKQYNQDFYNHLISHSANNQANEKWMSDTSRQFEQQGAMNQQLLSDINRTLTQMSDSFSSREYDLESNVTILKESLSRYVTGVEGTLGEKLEKVSRSFAEYVNDSQEAMKKEFKQIGEMGIENQTRSARQLQQTIQELGHEIQQLHRQLQHLSQETANQASRIRVGTND